MSRSGARLICDAIRSRVAGAVNVAAVDLLKGHLRKGRLLARI